LNPTRTQNTFSQNKENLNPTWTQSRSRREKLSNLTLINLHNVFTSQS